MNMTFGRDIARRCLRPRISGRNRCAAERGADGAARRPYRVQAFKVQIHSVRADVISDFMVIPDGSCFTSRLPLKTPRKRKTKRRPVIILDGNLPV